MNIFYYRLYGLSIASEVECPVLPPITSPEEIDVEIRYGKVIDVNLKEKEIWGFHVENQKDITLLIRGAGNFAISYGRKIVIEKAPEADESLVRIFLLGTAMGVLLHQRGFLPLHGNGIVHDGYCTAILGHSGMGKSTLAAAFRSRGYKLLSDDVCALKIRTEATPIVYPGIPRINLWHDSIEKVGADPKKMEQIHSGEEKFYLSIDAEYCTIPTPLKRIYVLSTHNEDGIILEQLSLPNKFRLLKAQTYRSLILKKMEATIPHFKMCANVVQHVQIARIRRPTNAFLLDELADLVEDDMKKTPG